MDDQWYCSSSFKAHFGSVWRVTWAHPEFGQLIATCSYDRSVIIWEEKVSSPPASPTRTQHQQQQQASAVHTSSHELPANPSSTWLIRAKLVDARASITDIKFAPKHLGLLLATCSSDGTVRIYEAPDIMNLSQWNPQNDLSCKISCSCLSWNPSPFHAPMIAVGSDEATDTSSSAPHALSQVSSFFSTRGASSSSATATTTSSKPLGRVFIFESGENARKWFLVEVLNRICEPVHDLAFACSVGRDYHLMAVASSDVQILTLKDVSSHRQGDSRSSPDSSSSPIPKYEIQQIAKFDDHKTRVWRLSWNLTGTILASSGEDGRVRLWKCESFSWTACSSFRSIIYSLLLVLRPHFRYTDSASALSLSLSLLTCDSHPS